MKKYLINLKGMNLDDVIFRLGQDKINLKNINKKNNEEIEFLAYANSDKELKKYFKNVEASCLDLSKKNFKQNILKSLAVYLALPIIIFYAIFYSKRIYKIEINGLNELSRSEIISALTENGIKEGEIKDVPTKEIEEILLKNNRVAQVSCYYRGTTLIINVSEKLVYTETEFQPICAKYDGVITNYTLKKGTLNFKVGDFVKAGEILVFPFVYDKFNNQISVEPEAEIEARIYKSYTSKLNKYETYYEKSGRVIEFRKIKFKSSPNFKTSHKKPFVFYEEKVYNTYISSILPFVKQVVVYEELIEKKRENDLVLMQKENEQASTNMAHEDNLDKEILLEKTYSVIANDTLFSTTTIVYNGIITT